MVPLTFIVSMDWVIAVPSAVVICQC